MTQRVDPNSPVPIFRQIADGLRDSVAAGVYRPGELVPSVRAQALTLLVNPNTVQRAYDELEREGLLVSKRGVGMAVANGSRRTATRNAADDVRAALTAAVERALAAGIDAGAIDALYGQARDEALKTANERRPT